MRLPNRSNFSISEHSGRYGLNDWPLCQSQMDIWTDCPSIVDQYKHVLDLLEIALAVVERTPLTYVES